MSVTDTIRRQFKAVLPLSLAIAAATIAVAAWLATVSRHAFEVAQSAETRSVRLESLIGRISYIDEVLTSSARLAASTGDKKWRDRYEEYTPGLMQTINEAIEVAGATRESPGFAETMAANTALLELEMKAFELIDAGDLETALAVLESPEYERQKTIHSNGMQRVIDMLNDSLDEKNAAIVHDVTFSLAAALTALAGVLGMWWVLVRMMFRQQRELAQLNKELVNANAAKSDFLAVMSHEIRTPLNGVLGMTSVLLSGDLSATHRKQVSTIKQCGETLLSLLNDILDLSKIEAGRVDIENHDFDLNKLLESMTTFWEPQFEAKGLGFSIDASPEIPSVVCGDPTRLRQILFNLISNALKFTNSGGVEIKVSVERSGRDVVPIRFEVRDTGVGISAEAQALLFKKFSQADASVTRNHGGSGLGLAICKKLANIMGGDIGVESAPGEGALFWFTVVFARSERTADELQDETQNEPKRIRKGLRILLAEDNQVNQMVVKAMLSSADCQIDVVGNGLEAISAVLRTEYDLVLMDIQMPEMDGVTATKKIRELDGAKGDLPIIAITANVMAGDKDRYIAAGMNAYIGKPVTQENLLRILSKFAPPEVRAA